MCLLLSGINTAWGEEESIKLADGVGTGSGTTCSITWSGTSCDITQTKGNSSTSVNSDCISAPRWYSGHNIAFKAKSGYTLTGATIVCTSNAYATVLMNSTYSTGASVKISSSTVTITCSGDFNIVMGAQSRISAISINYENDDDISPSASSCSFIFNTDEGLRDLEITKPENGAGTNLGTTTYMSGLISMTATDGSTATRVWNSSGETSLRVYKDGGSLTFSGSNITKIVFAGDNLEHFSASQNGYDASSKTWIGEAPSITFTANENVIIRTITITYSNNSDNTQLLANATASNGEANITILYGVQETLTCNVTNGQATSFQWYKTSEPNIEGSPIQGQTSKDYALPLTLVTATHYYYCLVRDGHQSIKTNIVTVKVEVNNVPTGTVYTKYSGELTDGDYLLVYDDGAMNSTITNNRLNYDIVTISDDNIQTDNESIVWHITTNNDGVITLFNAKANKFVVSNGKDNQIALDEDANDNAKWTVELKGNSTFDFTNIANSNIKKNATLRRNKAYGFACYGTGTGGALTLYKSDSSPELPEVNSIMELKEFPNNTKAILNISDGIVIGVETKSNYTNVYVQDATGGMEFYKYTGAEVAVGEHINGRIIGVYKMFNGTPEFESGSDYSNISISAGEVAPPLIVTITELAENTPKYNCRLVQLKDVYDIGQNNVLSQNGVEGVITAYNKFMELPGEWPEQFDLTGVFINYKTSDQDVLEIAPRDESDILVSKEDPIVSFSKPDFTYFIGETKYENLPTLRYPDDISLDNFKYTSSNSDLVTYNPTDGWVINDDIITTEGETATITASFSGDDKYRKASAICKFTVTKHKSSAFGWILNGTKVTSTRIAVDADESEYELPTLNKVDFNVTYESSNEEIAMVDSEGNITVDTSLEGNVTITARGTRTGYFDAEAKFDIEIYSTAAAYDVFIENFGDNGTANTVFSAATCYSADESMFTDGTPQTNYTGEGKVGKNTIDPSIGYSGASGLSAAWHTGTAHEEKTATLLKISNIDIEGASDINLSFGVFWTDGTPSSGNKLTCQYSIDGGEHNILDLTGTTKKWKRFEKEITKSGSSMELIFTHTTTGGYTVRIDDIKLNGRKVEKVEVVIGQTGYASLYYGKKNLVVPEGVDAYTYFVDNGILKKSHTYKAGDIIPKATAVVLHTNTPRAYQFVVSKEDTTPATNNMLRGTNVEEETTGGDLYYMLSRNAKKENNSVGFYWAKENGAAFMNGAHKAYLALSYEAANGVKSFSFEDAEDATAINCINIDQDNPLYNLTGQKVSTIYKGIVIKNGRKYLTK